MSLFQLKINNQDLTNNSNKTFLASDSVAGDATINVGSSNAFTVGMVIVVGQIGVEGTEIIYTHNSTVPTETVITLGSQLQQPHSRGTPVFAIDYDKYELTHAVSANDTKVFLTTSLGNGLVYIDPEAYDTLFNDTVYSSGGYFVRRFNSLTNNYSSYSDFLPYTGYADNTIGAVKNRALRAIGETIGDLITDQDLNDWLYEARRQMDQMPQVFRFTFRTNFDAIVGQCVIGENSVQAPADLRDRNTYKNILGIKFGRQNRPCIYQDRVRFNQNYLNVAHTTLNGSVLFGATSIVLTSSHDLDNSGNIIIAAQAVGGSRSIITYTANSRATNTISGVTGVPAGGLITGLDVWQNANFFGLPTAYTIDNGLIQFDVPFYDQLDGRDIIMDYYKVVPIITTDSQAFDEPFYDHYVSWLKWKIAYKKANGKIDRDSNSDYKDWMDGLGKVISQETNGQRIFMIPDVEGFLAATQ